MRKNISFGLLLISTCAWTQSNRVAGGVYPWPTSTDESEKRNSVELFSGTANALEYFNVIAVGHETHFARVMEKFLEYGSNRNVLR
jgi:hypothetical protein